MKVCETCGAELLRLRKHSRKQWAEKRFCDRKCAAQRLVVERFCACGCGDRLPTFKHHPGKYLKGHRTIKLQNGYVHLYRPEHPMAMKNGMVLEHRMIAYDAGWEITERHHLHHRNGIKHDNRLENLAVVAIDEHTRIHAVERAPAACPRGHPYTVENTAYQPAGWRYCKTCNRERARGSRPVTRLAESNWCSRRTA